MNIIQFKQFKSEYTFKGILAEHSLLQTVKRHTFLSYVVSTCNTIEARLTNSERTKHDKEGIIFFSYILYLCQFTSGMYDNFDTLLQWLNKDINTYVNEVTLKEALGRKI